MSYCWYLDREKNSDLVEAGLNGAGVCQRTLSNADPEKNILFWYTLSEAWSGVNWADLMAAQGAFGTDFYDRSVQSIVPTIVLIDLS